MSDARPRCATVARVGDETPTPKYSRRIQTSEDRDLAARRARTPASPFGVQIIRAPARVLDRPNSDLTSPYDLLEREPDHEVLAVVEKATRNAKDPAYFEDVAKLAVALSRERTGNRQREMDAEEVLREPARAARGSRRGLIVTVITAALSLAGAIDHRLSHSASEPASSADAIRELRETLQRQHDQEREQLQREREQERLLFHREIDRLDAELRAVREQLGRRSEIAPLVSAGDSPALTTTEGTFP